MSFSDKLSRESEGDCPENLPKRENPAVTSPKLYAISESVSREGLASEARMAHLDLFCRGVILCVAHKRSTSRGRCAAFPLGGMVFSRFV